MYNVARGVDLETVTTRLVSKSIGCCKKFPGKSALLTEEDVKHWLYDLSQELAERLEQDLNENNRKARQIVISFAQKMDKRDVSSSRSTILNSYETKKIFEDAFEVIKKYCLKPDGGFCLKFLGLSAGHFENMKNVREITTFFKVSDIDKSKNLNHFFDSMEKSEDILPIDEAGPSTSHTKQPQSDDEDSISSELFSNSETAENEEKDTSSFFTNYLNSVQKDGNSPVERNFNTSKILEEDAISSSSSDKQNEITIAVTNASKTTDENGKITCEECGKKILLTEIVSHNDYHYALKIVRSEADIYKPKPLDTKASIKDSKKRKQPPEKSSTLTKFLQNPKNSEESDGEICNDCNKRIRLEDMNSHKDYHIARKLHAEINIPTKNPVIERKLNNSSGKSNKKTKIKTDGKVRSVISFFKPL